MSIFFIFYRICFVVSPKLHTLPQLPEEVFPEAMMSSVTWTWLSNTVQILVCQMKDNNGKIFLRLPARQNVSREVPACKAN